MCCRALTIVGIAVLAVAALSLQLMAGEEALTARRTRLEQMSDAEKTRLVEKKRQFDDLSPEDQERYRELHRELVNHSQNDELRGTLQRYSDWVKTLSPLTHAELSKLPTDKRLARVKELMDTQATERFRLMVSDVIKSKDLLSPKDLNVICKWTDQFLLAHADEILALAPDTPHAAEMKASFDPDKHIHVLRFCYFRPNPRLFRGPRPGLGPPPDPLCPKAGPGLPDKHRPKVDPDTESTAEDGFDPLPKPSPEEESQLVANVSRQARDALDKATEGGERSRIIQNWMRAATFSRYTPPVKPEALDRFVRESLSKEAREKLESMPRERMYHELRKLYLRERFERGRRGMGRPGKRREGGGFGSSSGSSDRDGKSRNPGGPGPNGGRGPRGGVR